ncbi:Arylsulfatase [Allorhodopirellula heiligendammensis]|uniref:Arylsulfatase n=1 Tax=Allorhodopirellula heiligendammensis TaxID=2714739 RepID=A0A5C6C3S6_9BACT|nr:Arylsulfatase [Allorhodopirellula heiligendammensis]
MKRHSLLIAPICFLFATLAGVQTQGDDRPAILLIVAHHLGFSDLGCLGGEARTPSLNALADHGLKYSQFDNFFGTRSGHGSKADLHEVTRHRKPF